MLHFIITFIIFAAVAAGACIALYGWGLLFCRIAKYPAENRVLTIVIGLAGVIFLGGVLNLLRLAYGWAFDIWLIIGIVLAVKYGKFRHLLPGTKGEWFYTAVLSLVVIIIMAFTVKTQLRPRAFNAWDDLEKYFSHPVRMLQTGTLFGRHVAAPVLLP